MATWMNYPVSTLQTVCSSLWGKAMVFVVASILGIEAGAVCAGDGFVSVPEAFSTAVTMPLLLAIFGHPLGLLTYPVVILVFVLLLLRDLRWHAVFALAVVPLLLVWLDACVFFSHRWM